MRDLDHLADRLVISGWMAGFFHLLSPISRPVYSNQDYLSELLSQQQLDKALGLVKQETSMLGAMLDLIAAPDTPMVARIGVGAIMEELMDSEALVSLVDQLGALTHAEEANIRADAAHYLGLSGSMLALPWLQAMLLDSHEHVKEIAQDSIERLDKQG